VRPRMACGALRGARPSLFNATRRMSGASKRSQVQCSAVGKDRELKRVLLTNDDGPKSPFFDAWVKHLREELGWECYVCIPAGEMSFVSKSVSKGPLRLDRRDDHTVYVEGGSPAACVNIALHHLSKDVDLVLSGPNVGHNCGRSFLISSGTLGAAMEGALHNFPSIALSFPFFNGWMNWTEDEIFATCRTASGVVLSLWENWESQKEGLIQAEVYNVNVPLGTGFNGKYEIRYTKVDCLASYGSLFGSSDEDQTGDEFVWKPEGIRVFESTTIETGSDVEAVRDRAVSISPLRADFFRASQTVLPDAGNPASL